MVCIASRLRSVYGPAIPPNRGPDRPNPGTPRALLPPELSPGSRDLAAALRLVRPRTFSRQVPAHRLVQQMRIHLSREHGIGQFHLPNSFPLQISDFDDGHGTLDSLCATSHAWTCGSRDSSRLDRERLRAPAADSLRYQLSRPADS